MQYQNDKVDDNSNIPSLVGGEVETKHFDENYVPQTLDFITMYPTSKQLKQCTSEINNANISGNNNEELRNKLDEARDKQLQLENALFTNN